MQTVKMETDVHVYWHIASLHWLDVPVPEREREREREQCAVRAGSHCHAAPMSAETSTEIHAVDFCVPVSDVAIRQVNIYAPPVDITDCAALPTKHIRSPGFPCWGPTTRLKSR